MELKGDIMDESSHDSSNHLRMNLSGVQHPNFPLNIKHNPTLTPATTFDFSSCRFSTRNRLSPTPISQLFQYKSNLQEKKKLKLTVKQPTLCIQLMLLKIL